MTFNIDSVIEAAESLRHLEDLISAELQVLVGMQKKAADGLGKEVTDCVSKQFGGQSVFAPARPEQQWGSASSEMPGSIEAQATGTGARTSPPSGQDSPPLWRQIFDLIKDHLCADLKATSGIEEWRAASVADQVAWTFLDHYRGLTIYVPKDQRRRLAERDAAIVNRIIRETANSLALEFGISKVRVHQIVKKAKLEATRRGRTGAPTATPHPPKSPHQTVIYRTTNKPKG